VTQAQQESGSWYSAEGGREKMRERREEEDRAASRS